MANGFYSDDSTPPVKRARTQKPTSVSKKVYRSSRAEYDYDPVHDLATDDFTAQRDDEITGDDSAWSLGSWFGAATYILFAGFVCWALFQLFAPVFFG
jgi:hypothetical protein